MDEEVVLSEPRYYLRREKSELLKVLVKPLSVIQHRYQPGRSIGEDIYPPSSLGYYTRMTEKGNPAIFTLQQALQDEPLWLTISDNDGEILEAHQIQPYEVWANMNKTFEEHMRELENALGPECYEEARREALRVLDSPPLEWDELYQIIDGLPIAITKRGKTAKESLESVIPKEYPDEVREELMGYLILARNNELPKSDPIDFFNSLLPVPIMRRLLIVHFLNISSGIKVSEVLKLIYLASTGKLSGTGRPTTETEKSAAQYQLLYKLVEWAPTSDAALTQEVNHLNEVGFVSFSLPVTREEASKSTAAWHRRLGMLSGVWLRGYTIPESIGLKRLMYIGRAHRWPHKHSVCSSRLGSTDYQPNHVQIMTAPPSIVQSVKRILPTVSIVDWTTRTLNYKLYDSSKEKWNTALNRILSSVEKKASMASLKRAFGSWENQSPFRIGMEEAKVLDMIELGFSLSDLEHERGEQYWKIKREQANEILLKMHKKGVVRVSYETNQPNLVSLVTIAQGNANQVCSITKEMLLGTPTSLAMVCDNGAYSVLFSRIFPEAQGKIASTLPGAAIENGVHLSCFVPEDYRKYSWGLYQRLLKQDGTWDDDMSGLLSQIRSIPRELVD